jgi:hypothetical protein
MKDYSNFPPAKLYSAMDRLNKLRDMHYDAIVDYGHIIRDLHELSKTDEWRSKGLTTADLAPLITKVNEMMAANNALYADNLAFNRFARRYLREAEFNFDDPMNPRGEYDGVERGCSC